MTQGKGMNPPMMPLNKRSRRLGVLANTQRRDKEISKKTRRY